MLPNETIQIAKDHCPNFHGFDCSKQAALSILIDLMDRVGFAGLIERLEPVVKDEIIENWTEIIQTFMEEREQNYYYNTGDYYRDDEDE